MPAPAFASGMTLVMAGLTLLLVALSLIIQRGDLTNQLFSAAMWFGLSTILLVLYLLYRRYIDSRRKSP